jgi:hypothetical protein
MMLASTEIVTLLKLRKRGGDDRELGQQMIDKS